MADKEFPLSLIIKAVDQATAPLRAINAKIHAATEPVRKLSNSFKALATEAGIPRLVKSVGNVGTAIKDVAGEALSLGLKFAAMSAGAAFGLYHVMRGAVDAGDKLGEMAQRVGLSVDTYAQLQFAAAQADVEQEQFNSAMDYFNKALGQAKTESGPLLEFLNKVSPRLAMQVKGAKGSEQALGLMTEAFERVKDPAKRAALAAAVFGRSGLQMGQFLGQGSKAIEEQRRRFFALAGSQEKFAKESGDADNAIRETETAFLGLRNAAATELFPALTELAHALADVMAGNRGELAAWARETGKEISAWVKKGGITDVIKAMREWAGIITRVFDAIGGLKGALTLFAIYIGAGLLTSIASLTTALWGLGTAMLATPIGWFVLGVGALAAAGLLVYRNWEPIKTLFHDIWDTMKQFVAAPRDFWGRVFGTGGPGAVEKGGLPTIPNRVASGGFGAAAEKAALRPSLGTEKFGATSKTIEKTNEAHVTVDFVNMPRGARATLDPRSTAPIDLSRGYSLVTP